jgi:flavin reductase (DIM6/NTAB) family NADH-FMN oxidoreductase RutF
MEKVMVGKFSVGPGRTIIAGVMINGKPNYSTLGSFGGLSVDPPIVYISINKSHYSGPFIRENCYFSVNIPTEEIVQKMDYVGLVSGRDVDKSQVFTSFFGCVEKAPMIRECPANILCKVIDIINLPNNEVFVGEIVETSVNQDCLTNGKPDIQKMKPVVLGGAYYFSIGSPCGNAFTDGKALIKQ